MSITLVRDQPLALVVSEDEARKIPTIDAGAAYTEYLHRQKGTFDEEPLKNFVDVVSVSINPRSSIYVDQKFEYVDLREVDDIFGQILSFRRLTGRQIGSMKHRFQKGDLLFAKIMPSLENKKVALVTQDVNNAVSSTEFIVLRPKKERDINSFYLFRAIRSDHFTRQAVANVTGDTGRQRIHPARLLELKVIVAPPELRLRLGDAVEKEFTLRTLAAEQSKAADDESSPILGPITLRIAKASSHAATRKIRKAGRKSVRALQSPPREAQTDVATFRPKKSTKSLPKKVPRRFTVLDQKNRTPIAKKASPPKKN